MIIERKGMTAMLLEKQKGMAALKRLLMQHQSERSQGFIYSSQCICVQAHTLRSGCAHIFNTKQQHADNHLSSLESASLLQMPGTSLVAHRQPGEGHGPLSKTN